MARQTYHGSCHCGTVQFALEADLTRLTRCTCSICRKKGALLAYARPERFRLIQGEAALTAYRFHTMTASHLFCRHCGMHAFGRPRTDDDLYFVNVRCLDDFDVDTADCEIRVFDGRNWDG